MRQDVFDVVYSMGWLVFLGSLFLYGLRISLKQDAQDRKLGTGGRSFVE